MTAGEESKAVSTDAVGRVELQVDNIAAGEKSKAVGAEAVGRVELQGTINQI